MKCGYCNKEYKNVKQHEKYCKMNPNHKLMWNSGLTNETDERVAKCSKNSGIAVQIAYQRKNPLLEYNVKCFNCGKEFKIKERQNKFDINKKYFCSLECSHSYVGKLSTGNTKQAKCIECGKEITISSRASIKTCMCDECKPKHINKVHNSNKIDDEYYEYKKLTKKIEIIKRELLNLSQLKELEDKRNKAIEKLKLKGYHYINGKLFSKESRLGLHNGGCKGIQHQGDLRRSKNEIEFCKLCEEYFDNVKHNESIFNGWDADIIIEDIKFAVLWNGPWHYKQITKSHSVKQTQNRDKIKVKEIEECGWTPYIIKDMGKANKDFVKEKFNEFLKYLKENTII